MSGGSDLWRFVELLRRRRLFEPGAPIAIARAPGRLDVMGGIADYSGSLVLERPIAEGTCAAVQRVERPVLEVMSIGRTFPEALQKPQLYSIGVFAESANADVARAFIAFVTSPAARAKLTAAGVVPAGR